MLPNISYFRSGKLPSNPTIVKGIQDGLAKVGLSLNDLTVVDNSCLVCDSEGGQTISKDEDTLCTTETGSGYCSDEESSYPGSNHRGRYHPTL